MLFWRDKLNALLSLILFTVLSACNVSNVEPSYQDIAVSSPAHSHTTICEQFLAAMPPRGPERIDAGKPCKDSLPSLAPADQARILNHYASHMDGYIPQGEIKPLIAQLDKDASLPLRAHAVYFVLNSRSSKVDEELNSLHLEALERGDKVAEAHILFSKKIRPFMHSASPITDGDFKAALAISIEEEMHGFRPHVLNAIGRLARDQARYVDALENLKLAQDLFEANEDYAGQARINNNLADLYQEFFNHEKVVEHAERAVALNAKTGNQDHYTAKRSYIMLSQGLAALGRYNEAFDAVDMANSPETGPPDSMNVAVLDIARQQVLLAVGRREEAYELTERLLARDSMVQKSGTAINQRVWLANEYMADGNFADAQRHYDALMAVAATQGQDLRGFVGGIGDVRQRAVFATRMAALTIQLDRKDEAAKLLQMSTKINADLVDDRAQKAVAGHTLQTALQKREESLAEMEIEARNAELQLTASRLQSALAGLAALALGFIAFIAYRSFRTQKQLTAAQKQLTAEKITYLDEIHHRTKNNFQLLSSLLNMDIRRSGVTEQGEGRRLDAINRLQTMALVHDHIYSLDASQETTADLSEFIDDLLALLDTSLGRDDITLEWAVDGGVMDVTRLTPFGLLICEIVTNSYKHAFSDNGGKITIDIVMEDGTHKMTLKDNGMGFDVEAAKNKPDSLGMGLIFDLADQVGGTLSVESGANGTIWTFQ